MFLLKIEKKSYVYYGTAPLTDFKIHILRNCGDEKPNFFLHHILKGLNFQKRRENFFLNFWEPIYEYFREKNQEIFFFENMFLSVTILRCISLKSPFNSEQKICLRHIHISDHKKVMAILNMEIEKKFVLIFEMAITFLR